MGRRIKIAMVISTDNVFNKTLPCSKIEHCPENHVCHLGTKRNYTFWNRWFECGKCVSSSLQRITNFRKIPGQKQWDYVSMMEMVKLPNWSSQCLTCVSTSAVTVEQQQNWWPCLLLPQLLSNGKKQLPLPLNNINGGNPCLLLPLWLNNLSRRTCLPLPFLHQHQQLNFANNTEFAWIQHDCCFKLRKKSRH